MEVRMRQAVISILLTAIAGCSGGETGASFQALSPTTYSATKLPIVLIPGLLGFKTLMGNVDYFTGIPEALESGGSKVYVVEVSQANTPMLRSKQIIAQLDALAKVSGATRFNLVGHSQGAMDARLVAAVRPDLVASVTSIAGPHGGSPAAAFALSLPLGLGTNFMQAVSDFVKLLANESNPNNAKEALTWLSPTGAATFAAQYPAAMPTTPCGSGAPVVNGIHYYSWGGLGTLTNPLDPLDPMWVLLGPTAGLEATDGLIPQCSSHLGLVLRDNYVSNHTDETNLVFGLVSPFGPNPKTLYRDQANRLLNAGL
jgi:triacylglycerol lipase